MACHGWCSWCRMASRAKLEHAAGQWRHAVDTTMVGSESYGHCVSSELEEQAICDLPDSTNSVVLLLLLLVLFFLNVTFNRCSLARVCETFFYCCLCCFLLCSSCASGQKHCFLRQEQAPLLVPRRLSALLFAMQAVCSVVPESS